jgi:hypothetical protein
MVDFIKECEKCKNGFECPDHKFGKKPNIVK